MAQTTTKAANGSKGSKAKSGANGAKAQTRKSKDAESESGPTMRLALSMIYVDYDFNPRKKDREKDEYPGAPIVARSMLEVGQLQAVTVMKLGPADMKRLKTERPFYLVFGFTRHDAAVSLGWSEIKATVGEWETVSDAKLANMAENIAREDLAPYDKAIALHDLLEKEGISVRQLSNSIGQNHSYVSDLTNLIKVGNPMILRHWENGHAKATVANLKDVIWDAKRRDSHAKQMQAWMVLTHQAPDTDGTEPGEDGNEETAKDSNAKTADEIKRPTVKTVLKVLEHVKAMLKDKDNDERKEYLKGVKAALQFAGVLDSNISHVWTQTIRDEIKDTEEKAAEAKKVAAKEKKRQEKLADKIEA